MTEQDFAPFMHEAIALAEQGRWKACPNPTVGAVLARDGRVVARGWHHEAGQDHAEVDCLKDAAARGVDPKGCTLVVTLEPCNHQGKTPPCTQAILDAGISRVVMGLADPNPQAAGGAARLRDAGVEVIGPVCEAECRDLVADFLIWQSTDRPYVILKMAATLDGRIATRNGQSQWISCEASRREVQELRAGLGLSGGAVLVGGGTFRADNPRLTAREDGYEGPQPLTPTFICSGNAPARRFFWPPRPRRPLPRPRPCASWAYACWPWGPARKAARIFPNCSGPCAGNWAALMCSAKAAAVWLWPCWKRDLWTNSACISRP